MGEKHRLTTERKGVPNQGESRVQGTCSLHMCHGRDKDSLSLENKKNEGLIVKKKRRKVLFSEINICQKKGEKMCLDGPLPYQS